MSKQPTDTRRLFAQGTGADLALSNHVDDSRLPPRSVLEQGFGNCRLPRCPESRQGCRQAWRTFGHFGSKDDSVPDRKPFPHELERKARDRTNLQDSCACSARVSNAIETARGDAVQSARQDVLRFALVSVDPMFRCRVRPKNGQHPDSASAARVAGISSSCVSILANRSSRTAPALSSPSNLSSRLAPKLSTLSSRRSIWAQTMPNGATTIPAAIPCTHSARYQPSSRSLPLCANSAA